MTRSRKITVVHYAKNPYVIWHPPSEQIRMGSAAPWKVWLAHKAVRLLERLGAQFGEDKIEYKRIEFEENDFVERLFAEVNMVAQLWQGDVDHVYMGRAEFELLAQMAPDTSPLDIVPFQVSAKLGKKVDGMPHYRLLGIPVTVLPYMEGILPVPRRKR